MGWLDIFRRRNKAKAGRLSPSPIEEAAQYVVGLPAPQQAAALQLVPEGHRIEVMEAMSKARGDSKPKAWAFDPEAMAWHYASDVPSSEHPGTLGIDYGTLATIARLPVVGSIIQTRIQQIGEFAQPQPNPYAVGFKIRLRDVGKEPTRAELKTIKELTKLVMNAGGEYLPGGFDTFLRMIARDSLTYDQACFEVLRTRGGKPAGMVPVDAATIRRAKPSLKAMNAGRYDPSDIAFVQMINQKVVNEWTRPELGFGIRRPRTWIYANNYGYAELEEGMTIVTDLLNAQTFNSANFRTGIHTQSLLVLQSAMDDTAFRSFQRSVVSMIHGPRNSKRTPLIQLDPGGEGLPKEDLKAVSLSNTNREMEYSNWINWLLKIMCAVYQMDPAELGFVFGNEGQSSSLNSAGPSERIWASKERGLRPTLRSIQQWINDWIIWPINDAFMLEFVGFDSMSEAAKLDLDAKAVTKFKTVNEVRAEHDLDPIEGWVGDMILDPTFFQAFQQMRGEEQEEEQGGGDAWGGFDQGGGDSGGGGPPDGLMEQQVEPGDEGGSTLGQGAEALTRSIASFMQQQDAEGRLLRKSRRGPRGKWVPVPTSKGDNGAPGEGRVRAYMVEVD